jgi:SH3-like domain-containing protein
MRLTRFTITPPGRPLLPAAAVFAFAIAGGCAPFALAQTLQIPAHPTADQPVRAPVAAPRLPVHQDGHAAKAAPPVIPPHGPLHPHKPRAVAPVTEAPKAEPPATPEPATAAAPPAEKLPDPEKPDGSPAKLPRFASLRSDEVNMRAGPGLRYRIDWVYKRRDLPVEIMREFDVWRWVRDPDGIEGWMQQATLMGRRSFIIQKTDATLRSDANDTASAIAILKPGVIGRIRSCEATSDWCNVQSGSYRGYLRRAQFWGILPGETVAP